MKKIAAMFFIMAMLLCIFSGCATSVQKPQGAVRTVTDGLGRQVEVPEKVERVVCVGVGALRYSCYMQAADLIVGVEDYETKTDLFRLYNYVNHEKFQNLPIIGTNGVPNAEAIIQAEPQVIVLSALAGVNPDELTKQTGTPVVVVPGSDTTLDDKSYQTIAILGALYGREERAGELEGYLKAVAEDLQTRTANISDKPRVYVGGVSFKGHHGFEGTEAFYGPLKLINGMNLADSTGQTGAFNIDLEQVLAWNPDVIFVDFNGLPLIREHYAKNPQYYQSLTAVREGRVYSQISFRAYASNLETALADAYYMACVLYPEQFRDVDIAAKTGEIFTKLLGSNPYEDLKEAGYEFRKITLGP